MLEIHIGVVQVGSVSGGVFFNCCLFLFGAVLQCTVSSNQCRAACHVPHLGIIRDSGAENPVAVKSPAAAKILMHFQFPVH